MSSSNLKLFRDFDVRDSPFLVDLTCGRVRYGAACDIGATDDCGLVVDDIVDRQQLTDNLLVHVHPSRTRF